MTRPSQVDVEGVHIAVETFGAGRPCLVLHGFTGSAAAMAPLTRGLRGARVIVPDLVGHGRSDAPADLGAYAMGATVSQLMAVLDAHDADRAVVVGYSFGARVALSLAVAHPTRVRHLVTIGGTAGLTGDEAAARRAADDELAAAILERGVEAFVDRWEQAPIFATQRRLPDEVRRGIRSGRLANRPVGLANSLRAAGTGTMPPLWDALSSLPVACTIVVGALDTKFVEIGGRMVAQVPEATLEVVADAGHAVHVEAPAACHRIVNRVIQGEDGEGEQP